MFVCICACMLIERYPPPRGGFLFTMFSDQEPRGKGRPSKNLYQVLRGWSSYSRFLIREHIKIVNPPGGGGFFRSVYVCKYVSMFVSMYVCMHACVSAYVFVCVFACMYIHKTHRHRHEDRHRHRHRHTQRHTHTQRHQDINRRAHSRTHNRQTPTHTHTHTHAHTHTHTQVRFCYIQEAPIKGILNTQQSALKLTFAP